jgi:hypothetical protein
VVSLLIIEVEYHGLVEEGIEELWIHQLLGELGLPI